MKTWFFDSPDPEHTFACAADLGRSIGRDGLVIALVGPLGAGKTVFVKGLADGLGIDARLVSSPTFVIAQQYPIPVGPEALHHVDLYRLESSRELESIAFDDMFAPGQVLAVEWADRFPDELGKHLLQIEFEGPTPAEEDAAKAGAPWRGRRARITAEGADPQRILGDWAQRVDGARADGRRGAVAGSTPESKLLLMLILGISFASAAPLDLIPDPPRCSSLIEVEGDELGTLRARCGEPTAAGFVPVSGIARLLAGERIDLNRASTALLRSLPQIGPTRAQAIVRERDARKGGRFASVDDLESVRGIGPKTLARLRHWLMVGTATEFREFERTDFQRDD
jgi:tRNA threonylcarbamoyladenosine biosynthesis protein TsaE